MGGLKSVIIRINRELLENLRQLEIRSDYNI